MDYIVNLINRILNSITSFDVVIIKVIFFSLLLIYLTFIITYYIKKLHSKKNMNIENISTYRASFSFIDDYNYTIPPSDLPPALVNLLVNKNFINPHMITNSLMYLIKHRLYIIKEISINNITDLEFIYTNYSNQPTERHLRYLIDWFSSYSKNKDFSLNTIYKSLLTKEGERKFIRCYHTWIDLVRKDAIELDFYHEINGTRVLSNFWMTERHKWLSFSDFIKYYFTKEINLPNINEANDILIYSSAMLLSIKTAKDFSNRFVEYCIKNIYYLDISNNNKIFSYYNLIDSTIRDMFIKISTFKSTDRYTNTVTGAFKSKLSNAGFTTHTR